MKLRFGRTRSYTINPHSVPSGISGYTTMIHQVVSPGGRVMCGCANPRDARKIRRALELMKQGNRKEPS